MKSIFSTSEVYPAAFVRTTHRPRRRILESRLWVMERLTPDLEKSPAISGAFLSVENVTENNTRPETN